jgi:hypothetical protein
MRGLYRLVLDREKIAGFSENDHMLPTSRKSGEFLALDVKR